MSNYFIPSLNCIFCGILGNSTEGGIWSHIPNEGEDLIITHTSNAAVTFCKIESPILKDYLHLSTPTNALTPDKLR